MLNRRRFLTHLPLGFAGAAIACSKSGPEASSTARALAQAVGASRSAPLLKSVAAGSATLSWTPQHSDLVYTFGGAAPGDTVAVPLLKGEPARDYAVSSCGPGWALLAPTDRTAILGPDLREV